MGPDNETGIQDVSRSAPLQQYWLVRNFELKVTTSLATTQDDQTKSMTVNGSATTCPYFIPNKGDMFLADMGDGRQGRYTVTNTEKKTYLKESLYVIEYTLLGPAESNYTEDLTRKTVKTTYFVKDFLTFGQNPMVLSADYNDQIAYQSEYRNLVGQYFSDFFSHEYQTLIIPGQNLPSYDPFLPKAVTAIVAADEHPLVGKIRFPGVGGDEVMACTTLWDALLGLNTTLLPSAMQHAMLFSTKHFRSLPRMSGIYYSGIAQVVYPLEPRTDVDAGYRTDPTPPMGGFAITFGGRRYNDLERLVPGAVITGFNYDNAPLPGALPDVLPVTADDFYVFTAGFYGRQGMAPASKLEVLTLQAIRGDAVDAVVLHHLAQQALTWENLERFYYTPVLLALLKTVMRRN